ncbi:nitrogen fixation protein NifM [Caldichromatium japonicum]|uniref:peptidylprolyl isomerase n=1 Tax=Caldichromatium japonicum TaxID=2699430 RepID=A0A6G7VEU0_9GAMM|nr:nitrogen fixation protein NifM [Caldichromatium japonicum]QIK38541.1 nitrogen fixation protein NifM [Caldichromatium japonicum]
MTEAASPWLVLKLAHEFYGKSPQALAAEESRRIAVIAQRQAEIERRVLASVEAAGVVLPAAIIERALAEIRARYDSEDDYRADLMRADLSPDSLRAAVEHDLLVEAVLERVAGRAPMVSDTDVEIFYLQNHAKFAKPETRTLRHILVTINDALPGSERHAAAAKIAAILARLRKDPTRFAEQALKHSECPTAMNGGLLGTLPRGQLYAALDAVAFALPAGSLSDIVESPLGFHILWCEKIDPARTVPLAEAREKVRAHLTEQRRQAAQKAWIASLPAA